MRIQECPTTKICNKCDTEKDIKDFYVRRGYVQKYCLKCKAKAARKHYVENKESYDARTKKWANDNRETRRATVNAYDARNRDKIRKYHADRAGEVNALRREEYAKNPEEKREASKAWFQENKHRPDVIAARNAVGAYRRFTLRSATPVWADKDKIKQIYLDAQTLQRKTGIPQNVDHQIPLVHDLVCGLHVHENLEIMPAFENQSKGNTFTIS